MLTLPVSVSAFVARGATDLRWSFDRLSAQVQERCSSKTAPPIASSSRASASFQVRSVDAFGQPAVDVGHRHPHSASNSRRASSKRLPRGFAAGRRRAPRWKESGAIPRSASPPPQSRRPARENRDRFRKALRSRGRGWLAERHPDRHLYTGFALMSARRQLHSIASRSFASRRRNRPPMKRTTSSTDASPILRYSCSRKNLAKKPAGVDAAKGQQSLDRRASYHPSANAASACNAALTPSRNR